MCGCTRYRQDVLYLPLLVLVTALQGCSTLTQLLPSHREAEERAERMQELQLRVMRFSDAYVGRVREAALAYQSGPASGQQRLNAQEWKVQQSTAAYTIASGSNPLISTLDMVVLATLSRMVIDDAWVRAGAGERGQVLLDTHVSLEADAWRLVEDVLNEQQKSELHEVIDRWRAKHPYVDSVAYIHFTDFAAAAGLLQSQDSSPENLFSVFGLDVFSGLDPAVREIAQTRELAERSIFYLQRAPTLLDLQIERLAYQFAVTPEAQGLLTDAEHLARIGIASDRLVTMMPDLLARERAAAISQLMQELEQRSRSLAAANTELRLTLEAGTDTAQALQETLATLDHLTARLKTQSSGQAAEGGKPFDPQDYAALLREAQATLGELDRLALRIERVLPQTADAARSTTSSFRSLMDRAFVELLVLILVTCASILAAALGYRAITHRLRWHDATVPSPR